MMKYRNILLSIFLVGGLNGQATEPVINESWYKKAVNEVSLMRGSFLKYPEIRNWAIAGAATGAVSGAAGKGGYEWLAGKVGGDFDTTGEGIKGAAKGGAAGTVIGGAVGAIIGGTMSVPKRKYALWKINKALKKHTQYSFKTMPMDAAVMMLLAFQTKRQEMRVLAPYILDFLQERGMMGALASVYYSGPKYVFDKRSLSQKVRDFEKVIWVS